MKLLSVVLLVVLAVYANAQFNPNQWNNRNTIVHLFEWKYKDIADECEQFLAPNGFAGVQTSVPQENRVIPGRPWYERYQPVSYKFITRSGTEADFLEMSRRCNAVGVRIYPDIIINHMAAGSGTGWVVGTGGSEANSDTLDFPAVPFGPNDFNQPQCGIDPCYCDVANIRNCNLVGLTDLRLSSQWVRDKAIEFMNRLVDLGVAGFRVDTVKHMWPGDLEAIFPKIKNLNTAFGFAPGTKPFFASEVIDLGGEAISKFEYKHLGTVTEFSFQNEIGRVFTGGLELKNLRLFGESWGLLPSDRALTFVDNHDSQRGDNPNTITYKRPRIYKMATAFHLAFTYGVPRIMSSYAFTDYSVGPPMDSTQAILSRTINADGSCGNGWVCEHRWRQIFHMVKFANVVKGTSVENFWDNGSNQISFSRGNRGFIAFNGQFNVDLNTWLQTGLPAGTYCDVISGDKVGASCSGRSAVVFPDGRAEIILPSSAEDGVFAIHAESKL
ncbi:unnamed protein product [Diamesa serratosioi]